jgi:hypothetical protein
MGLVGADRVFWMSTVQVMVVDLVSAPLFPLAMNLDLHSRPVSLRLPRTPMTLNTWQDSTWRSRVSKSLH